MTFQEALTHQRPMRLVGDDRWWVWLDDGFDGAGLYRLGNEESHGLRPPLKEIQGEWETKKSGKKAWIGLNGKVWFRHKPESKKWTRAPWLDEPEE